MDIKNMPYVTVEQVSKFRDAALQALEQKDAEIAELNDLLTKALDERDYFYKQSRVLNLETYLNEQARR